MQSIDLVKQKCETERFERFYFGAKSLTRGEYGYVDENTLKLVVRKLSTRWDENAPAL